jgi:hypothetical protein
VAESSLPALERVLGIRPATVRIMLARFWSHATGVHVTPGAFHQLLGVNSSSWLSANLAEPEVSKTLDFPVVCFENSERARSFVIGGLDLSVLKCGL